MCACDADGMPRSCASVCAVALCASDVCRATLRPAPPDPPPPPRDHPPYTETVETDGIAKVKCAWSGYAVRCCHVKALSFWACVQPRFRHTAMRSTKHYGYKHGVIRRISLTEWISPSREHPATVNMTPSTRTSWFHFISLSLGAMSSFGDQTFRMIVWSD